MTVVGVAYRPELAAIFGGAEPRAECTELIGDRYFAEAGSVRRPWEIEQVRDVPIVVHGLCGNVSSAIGPSDRYLEDVANVLELSGACLYSDHLAFTGTSAHALGHLSPNLFDDELLELAAGHIERMVRVTGRRPCLENLATSTTITGSKYSPEEFYLRLLEASGSWDCLVDLTNIWINSTTRPVDAQEFVDGIPPERVKCVHLAGGELHEGMFVDTHSEPVHDEAFDLLEHLMRTAEPELVIIERDSNWSGAEQEVRDDLARAQGIVRAAAVAAAAATPAGPALVPAQRA